MQKLALKDGAQTLSHLAHRLRQPDMLAVFARGTGLAFMILATGTALKYLSQILLARWMGPAEYGAYYYAFSWAQLLAVLAALGLTLGVLRFIPEYLVTRDWGRLRGIVRRGCQLALVVGFAIAALATLGLLVLRPPNVDLPSLVAGIWLAPLLALLNLQMEMTRGTQRIAPALFPSIVLQPLLTTFFAFIILQLFGRLTGLSTLGAVCIALLVALVMQVIGLQRSLPREAIAAAPRFETPFWLKVSFPMLLIALFGLMLSQTDVLVLGLFVGPAEAGIYGAASRTANLVSFLLLAVNAIAAPMIGSFYANRDFKSLQQMVTVSTRWLFWSSLVFALILILFGEQILSLFGPEFTAGRSALALLAVGQFVNASAGSVGYLMTLTGHQNLSMRVFGWSALINVILNVMLIPRWGLEGAALSTMVTTILWNLWLAVLVRRHLNISSFVFVVLADGGSARNG